MTIAGVSPGAASNAITMSSGSASSASDSAVSASAGSARLPTITGCTNSTATWCASDQPAGEPPTASSRPPRAKRAAISPHSRASRSASAANHDAFASRRRRRRAPPSGGDRRRAGSAASHSRNASTPSPVRALTSIRCDARVHGVEVAQELLDVELQVREQVDLVDDHELARRGTSAGT